ncbi:Ribosomal RNA methyltransferase (FmrO) [uncultured archaeon]|nr:Ribosomal RNA methyltransferase (FmrO) [uncultured archaeon]
MNIQILNKIREKREFSQLSEKDIELAYEQFEKRQASDEEKIKLTRELLRKTFSAFISKKLLSLKSKEPNWILRKHISTRERLPYYKEIYKRIFEGYKKASVIDLGAGINGFSFDFFKKVRVNADYIGIESVGQLVELMNFYFKQNKKNGRAINLSLFEKEKVKEIIQKTKKPRVVFLFKVIDALESLKWNYSKELISEIVPLAERVVISFATKSLGSRERFKVKRNWIVDFIKENFKILDDFEIGGERYLVFNK